MTNYLLFIGVLLMVIGAFIIIFQAFGESIIWGLACLLFSPAIFAFIATRWPRTRSGLWLIVSGSVFWFFGFINLGN
jgi:hypothetical protein